MTDEPSTALIDITKLKQRLREQIADVVEEIKQKLRSAADFGWTDDDLILDELDRYIQNWLDKCFCTLAFREDGVCAHLMSMQQDAEASLDVWDISIEIDTLAVETKVALQNQLKGMDEFIAKLDAAREQILARMATAVDESE